MLLIINPLILKKMLINEKLFYDFTNAIFFIDDIFQLW